MRKMALVASCALAIVITGCSASQDEGIVLTGSKASPNADRSAPPPPPPPPPPAASQAITVTGARIQNGVVAESASPMPVITADEYIDPATGETVLVDSSYRYFPPVFVPAEPNRDRYDGEEVSSVKLVANEPVSTFSVDVDTGAYTNARRFISEGQMPPEDAVRTEEFVNYFRYDYARPRDRDIPFTVNTDVAVSPWNAESRLVRIGLAGYEMPAQDRPPANLVFLLDVSGSMASPDKLPLVKTAMRQLAGQLTERDKVSIVVYAGAAGLVLEPTNDARKIKDALDLLEAGGSTAGGAGIELAYRVAEANRIEGGVNRVILATDGDFNVGTSDQDALVELIEKKRETGVTLSVLGFGRGNLNDAMMEQVANNGNGNYSYIDSALEARKVLGDEMGATLFTIAKDVKIQVEFNPAVISQYRLVGYENRILREEDFDNDAVDAGDIGAGHQVTALYEVVPAGAKGWIGQRRYEDKVDSRAHDLAAEAAFIKLRYKQPDGEKSSLITYTLPASALRTTALPGGDFAFASAVAAFGQKLRGDPMLASFGYGQIAGLAGNPRDYWRQEFVQLVKTAEAID
ncbi:VWA domain-containing protein [Qipengyuania sp. XHP0207]|uniref:vWA domain-containing protein n=1 Tax=Qipengyuania sp. XHP0207 TaxID=3038078 RepID=UPI00241DDFEB|nr:VWA domain-containing protein [Qipengyuania sp. XHP0207]MDG5746968.1 VWA domain-containing protein [Qipengyuania sp. XHP0207]